MIDSEIANKLSQCSPSTLLSVNKIIDILLEQQEREKIPFPIKKFLGIHL